MKSLFLALVLTAAAWTCAAAETPAEASGFHPLIGLGGTFGGTTIGTVLFTNGSTCNIHAGGLIDVYGGVEYRYEPKVAVQATVGYHVDRCNASNGDLRFERYPIELLAYYGLSPRFRAGGGVRFVQDPHISGSGIGGGADVKFNSTTGGVIEGEYLLPRSGWVQVGFKLRYVFEHYQLEGGGPSATGNHVGIFGAVYF